MRHYVVNLYNGNRLLFARGGPARNRKHALQLAKAAMGERPIAATLARFDLDGDPRTRLDYVLAA